jgi:sentrin-specific protease 6
MLLIDTDGLSKIRLNYGDQSAEGAKMLEDELIDFSEDQDNQVKPNA